MQRELLNVRYQLASALRSATSPFIIFSLAALLSDHGLCGDALAKGNWTYNGAEQGAFGEGVESGNVFDISALPLERLIWLSTETLWTLARASRKNPSFENNSAKCRAMGDEYVRLMKLRGESWQKNSDGIKADTG